MKSILRTVIVHAVALFACTQLIAGLKVLGGIDTYLFGGLVLSLLSFFIRPVLTVLTLPFNFATMGAFSFLTNALLLYFLTLFIPQIIVTPFVFQGANLLGFIIPKISFNLFFAYIVCAFILSIITSGIYWLIE